MSFIRRAIFVSSAMTLAVAILAMWVVPTTSAHAAVNNGVGLYDSTSTELRYSPSGWRVMSSSSDISGSSQYLNAVGGVEFTFYGDSIEWISRLSASSGINDVYIDGIKVASVDRYSATNKFAATVFRRSGLGLGTHTIAVKWIGKKNPSSTGTNLLVDAFRVVDTVAPPAPTGLTGNPFKSGVALSWNAVAASDVAGYRVYRTVNTGGISTLVGTTSATVTTLHDAGLQPSSWWRYKVTAVDTTGNESVVSVAKTVKADHDRTTSAFRYDKCPAATSTVSTADGLRAALEAATPGTVIKMAPGVYTGQFEMKKSGTTSAPIWICGPRDAIIDGGQLTKLHGIFVDTVDNVVVTGFTIQNALKGVTVKGGSNVTISDLVVQDIGYEGVHVRQFTTDSTIIGNTIRRIGLVDPKYGEGIYIGSSEANWCALTGCQPDTVDRTRIIGNIISATGAQSIEAKEGTRDGLIHGNRVDDSVASSYESSWVLIKGNGWVVANNIGTGGYANGYSTNASVAGWGMNNIFNGNTAELSSTGFGYWMHQPVDRSSVDNIVGCENTSTGASSGQMNVACQP